MPGAERGAGSVAGVGAHRAVQGAVCACPKPYSPSSILLCGEHKSCRKNLTQSDST